MAGVKTLLQSSTHGTWNGAGIFQSSVPRWLEMCLSIRYCTDSSIYSWVKEHSTAIITGPTILGLQRISDQLYSSWAMLSFDVKVRFTQKRKAPGPNKSIRNIYVCLSNNILCQTQYNALLESFWNTQSEDPAWTAGSHMFLEQCDGIQDNSNTDIRYQDNRTCKIKDNVKTRATRNTSSRSN